MNIAIKAVMVLSATAVLAGCAPKDTAVTVEPVYYNKWGEPVRDSGGGGCVAVVGGKPCPPPTSRDPSDPTLPDASGSDGEGNDGSDAGTSS